MAKRPRELALIVTELVDYLKFHNPELNIDSPTDVPLLRWHKKNGIIRLEIQCAVKETSK